MIQDALQEVGAARSIVIDEAGVILAGNATVEAAAAAGITRVRVVDADGEELIAVRRSGLTGTQKTRLALFDNRGSELATWDADQLAALQAEDAALLAGLFRDEELAALIPAAEIVPGNGGDEFDATPVEGPTRCQPGDVWALGPHRLIVGDSTQPETYANLLQGTQPALVVTSPPYGVGKDYEAGGVPEWRQLINDVFSLLIGHGAPWFVNLANRRTGNDGYEAHTFGMMVNDFAAMGVQLLGLRIWAKDPAWAGQMPIWHQTYKPVDDFEFLGLFAGAKPKHKNRLTDAENKEWGFRGVWEMASVHANKEHSAGYPVELPWRAMRMLTDAGDPVLDPFLGSGTTLIAAQRTGRICYGCELSPQYADVVLRRAEAEGIGPIERLTAT
jgi:hypothetical protein